MIISESAGSKVLIVTGSLLIGGVETLILDTAGELSQRRKYAPIICNISGLGEMTDYFRDIHVPVYALMHGKDFATVSSTIMRLRALIKDKEVTIIHAHQYAAGLYSRIASLGLNVPVIYHTHNTTYPLSFSKRLIDIYLTQVNTSVCIAVTQEMAANLAKSNPLAAKKTRIFYNAVNKKRLAVPADYDRNLFRSELGIDKSADIIVGAVGRLDEDKRYDLLLESFAKTLSTIPNAWLIIVGGGSLENELRSIAVELQVAQRVIFTGYRNDIGQLISAMDILVISSRTEAFPMVALEAMNCGVPVIMTETVSAREVLRDCALVVGYDSGKIAEGILNLYMDRAKSKKLSQCGYNLVREQFSLATYIDRLENLYDNLSNQ